MNARRAIALLVAPLVLAACSVVRERNEAADRAAVHALLTDYGTTLDARDFDGFAALFAKQGVYVAGNGGEASGAEAGEAMRKVFSANALGFREPNFHVFFNEVVSFSDADHASATSMSLYMVPDDDNRPSPAMMARYVDQLVREEGQWKFARREVHSLIPAPR